MNKQEAIKYINSLPENVELDVTISNKIVSSGELEKLGISRQLLRYYVNNGYIRTIPHGKQKRYVLDDVLRVRGKK